MQNFDEVYKEYSDMVYRFLLRLCRNENLAGELTQETFFKAVVSSNSFRGECRISSWLCQIARNEYLNYIKKKDNNHSLPDENTADDKNIEDIFDDKEQARKIYKALHVLSEPYKEIFTLRIFGELKFSEIGEIFGKSEVWARVNFFRAKEKIIDMMEE